MMGNIAVSSSLPQSLVSRDVMLFMDAESLQHWAVANDAIEAMYESKYGWYWQVLKEMCDKVFCKKCSSAKYDDFISFFNLYDMNVDIIKLLKFELGANAGYVFKLLSGPIKVETQSFPNLSLLEFIQFK